MCTADHYGLIPAEPMVDLKSVMNHVRSVIDEIYQPTAPDELHQKRNEGYQEHNHEEWQAGDSRDMSRMWNQDV